MMERYAEIFRGKNSKYVQKLLMSVASVQLWTFFYRRICFGGIQNASNFNNPKFHLKQSDVFDFQVPIKDSFEQLFGFIGILSSI